MFTAKPFDSPFFLKKLYEGDEDSVQALFELYYPSLCLYAEKILKDSMGAEDVVEDVFFKLWQNKPRFNSLNHLKAHLYLSVRNGSLNVLKMDDRAGRRQHEYLTFLPLHDECHLAEITRQEGYRLLYEAVKTLSPQAQKIITLTFLEGKSNQEVADQLDLSIHTVKAHKRRALELLRSRIPSDLYFMLPLSFSIFLKSV